MFGALDLAVKEMKKINCQNCIVVGVDNLNPNANHKMTSIGLNMGCVFLQKRHASKRIYSRIMDSKLHWGRTHNSQLTDHQPESLEEVYHDWNVDPSNVTYVENCGRNINNQQNMRALNQTLVKSNRNSPLIISSDESSIGPMSGMTAIMKVIISIHRGSVPAISKQRLSVILNGHETKCSASRELSDGLIAMNAQCDGDSAHVLLQPNSLNDQKRLGTKILINFGKL